MCQNKSTENLTVQDIFQKCEFRACEADSMEDVAKNAPECFCVIPVFDYSQKYIGALQPCDFVKFQNKYFDNLEFNDRGNEFVLDPEDTDIHFVPISRVSRYVDKSIQPIGLDESVAQTEKILCEQQISAAPVFDADNNIVGTISLLDIARARFKKKCCKSSACGKRTNMVSAIEQGNC